jgi:2-isopropylmalate synthase
MALRTRQDYYGCTTGIATERLVPTSRLVSNITGIQVQRNKAIVGRNAFAHEAGIHQDGMLKERSTYEIMRPEDVGLSRTDLVLGKHSGRAALGDRVKALGYTISAEQLQTLFVQFKALADKKKEVYDADIAALIEEEIRETEEVWSLSRYTLTAATGAVPKVVLTLKRGDEEITRELSTGDGPFDALFLAIEQITGIEVVCRDFRVHSVSVGKDAQGEVTVEVEYRGQIYRGRGVSTDSVEASVKAFLNAINRIASTDGKPPAKVSPYQEE